MCLKVSSASELFIRCLGIDLLFLTDSPVSLRSALYSCARLQRERESTLIVTLFTRLFSPLHQFLSSSVPFFYFKKRDSCFSIVLSYFIAQLPKKSRCPSFLRPSVCSPLGITNFYFFSIPQLRS